MIGIEPWSFSLRELMWMHDNKFRHDWDQTAGTMAMIANTVRDSKKRARPYAPEDFHPTLIRKRREQARKNPVPITVLRDIFVDGKIPEGI